MPTEILVQIFDWLHDPPDLLSVSVTSKKWQAFCEQWVWPKKYDLITEILYREASVYMKHSLPLNSDLSKKIQFFKRLEQIHKITHTTVPKSAEKRLGNYFYARPEALFTVLIDLVKQPHPHYSNVNRLQAQATSKFFSVCAYSDHIMIISLISLLFILDLALAVAVH
jgi:hypothetical protein